MEGKANSPPKHRVKFFFRGRIRLRVDYLKNARRNYFVSYVNNLAQKQFLLPSSSIHVFSISSTSSHLLGPRLHVTSTDDIPELWCLNFVLKWKAIMAGSSSSFNALSTHKFIINLKERKGFM